jgi:hypothetical protein
VIPFAAITADRRPDIEGIAQWMRFTEPPPCLNSFSPPAWLPAIPIACSVATASRPRSRAHAAAAPNGPTAHGT